MATLSALALRRRLHSPQCNLCHFLGDVGEEVVLVSGSSQRVEAGLSTIRLPGYRLWGPQTFLYHPFCLNICLPLLSVYSNIAKSRDDLLRNLERSLAPALPICDPPTTIQVLRNSLCQQTLARILDVLARTSSVPCVVTCTCPMCLIRRLYRLPNELLSGFIAPHLISGDLARVFSIFGETFSMLAQRIPAQPLRIPYRNALFVTRINFMGRSYISALHSQYVSDSQEIPHDALCKYVIVQIDTIGVTDIRFLPSEAELPVPRLGSWAYAVEDTSELYLQQTGNILKRITSSPNVENGQQMWDCAKLPFIFNHEPVHTDTDTFSHYVPLENASGISVAICAGYIQAIIRHENQDRVDYGMATEDAVWIYHPLSVEDILEVWWMHNTLLSGLVIRTSRTLLWFSTFRLLSYPQGLDFTCIGSGPIRAVYYTDYRCPDRYINCVPRPDRSSLSQPPQLPLLRREPLTRCLEPLGWFYSEAPLKGVVHAQLCLDEEWCIGILFQYQTEVRVVGEYRFDKHISPAFHHPGSISVVQRQHGDLPRVRVDFGMKETKAEHFVAMEGSLIWWFGKGFTVVEFQSPLL